MGKLFFLMGKSSTGKDSIYNKLLERPDLSLRRIVLYTTRPIRSGETDGIDYHFCTVSQMQQLEKDGKIIEKRTYSTVLGEWYYFTVDDGQIDFNGKDLIMIGTLESYEAIKSHYSSDNIVPIYIEVEDGIRLMRALEREMRQDSPRYDEMCRRFLADKEDFSPERLRKLGITNVYRNDYMDKTVENIATFIKG